MTLNPIALIDDLIREHGSSSILRDHLNLLREEILVRDRKIADLTVLDSNRAAQLAQLQILNEQNESKIHDLEQIIDERNQFVESHGAYFKKDGHGGYHDAVYCGSCRTPTSPEGKESPGNRRFACKCGWKSSFRLSNLREVRNSLPN